MSPKLTRYLLEELCVDLGFCLPPSAQSEIVSDPPIDVDAFVDAVICAEGFEPSDVPKPLLQDMRNRVAKYFAAEEDSSSQAP
jgi:hypothetical protein